MPTAHARLHSKHATVQVEPVMPALAQFPMLRSLQRERVPSIGLAWQDVKRRRLVDLPEVPKEGPQDDSSSGHCPVIPDICRKLQLSRPATSSLDAQM